MLKEKDMDPTDGCLSHIMDPDTGCSNCQSNMLKRIKDDFTEKIETYTKYIKSILAENEQLRAVVNIFLEHSKVNEVRKAMEGLQKEEGPSKEA